MSNEALTKHAPEEAAKLHERAVHALRDHAHGPTYLGIPLEHLADDVADDERVNRENCGACALIGFDDTADSGMCQPNYAGWERIYVQAGVSIPAKYREAFRSTRAVEDAAYARSLAVDILTFGVQFQD